MYKIIFGYCDNNNYYYYYINCHHYFDIIGITRARSKHEYKIRPKVARTNYFKYSFFHRYINDWNSLPSEVMSSPSLQFFKVVLRSKNTSDFKTLLFFCQSFFFFWRVCLSMGIWFPPTTVLLTIFAFLFDCTC